MRTLALLALLGIGCHADPSDDQTTRMAAKMATFSDQVAAADRRMHQRYAAAKQIEYTVAVSDLEGAHASARMIDGLIEPDLLPAWQPYAEAVRDAARQVEYATGLGGAARATSILGMRCASCHEAIHAAMTFDDTPRPDGSGATPRMVDHEWAAMQMWQGLIGPSQARWMTGASALTQMPVNLIASAVTPAFQGDIDDVARVRLLATRAANATTIEQHQQIFSDLLASCAHCHETLRDR
jgi:cytochrome c553